MENMPKIKLGPRSGARPSAPYAPLGCSNSDSETPRTDGWVQSAMDDPYGPYVYADRCRQLERELAIALSGLRYVAESHGLCLDMKLHSRKVLDRISGHLASKSGQTASREGLNPGADRTRHLVPGTVEPIVGHLDS